MKKAKTKFKETGIGRIVIIFKKSNTL